MHRMHHWIQYWIHKRLWTVWKRRRNKNYTLKVESKEKCKNEGKEKKKKWMMTTIRFFFRLLFSKLETANVVDEKSIVECASKSHKPPFTLNQKSECLLLSLQCHSEHTQVLSKLRRSRSTAVAFCCQHLSEIEKRKKNMHFFRICVNSKSVKRIIHIMHYAQGALKDWSRFLCELYAVVYTNMEFGLTDTLWLHDNYMDCIIIIAMAVGRWLMVDCIWSLVASFFFSYIISMRCQFSICFLSSHRMSH